VNIIFLFDFVLLDKPLMLVAFDSLDVHEELFAEDLFLTLILMLDPVILQRVFLYEHVHRLRFFHGCEEL